MANTTIKITQLPNIGEDLAANTLLPVVNTSGTAITEKVTVGNVANFILTEAGNLLPEAFVAQIAYSVANAAQPNITSTGILTSLSVSGNINAGNINLVSNLVLDASQLILGGGENGYVLQTDGEGNLSWTAQTGGGGGGNGTPGGSNTQLQFNNNGSFGGIANVTYDGSNISLGSISTVKIQGGLNNEIISTDGAGNLSFRSIALNLSVGTHTVPSYVPVTNSTFQVLSRTGNVTVNLY